MGGMTLVYLVQHGEKEPLPGDPGLTQAGRGQATAARASPAPAKAERPAGAGPRAAALATPQDEAGETKQPSNGGGGNR